MFSVLNHFSSTLQALQQQTSASSPSGNSIDCKFQKSWSSSMTPAQACVKLNDPMYPVPFMCSTSGQQLCCTVSNFKTATFNNLGTCSKVQGAVPIPAPTTPTVKPPTRKPSKRPTKKPSSTTTGTQQISCTWYSNFKDKSPAKACADLNSPTYRVPYLCKDGRKVCCTVSNFSSTTMTNFGTCTKV